MRLHSSPGAIFGRVLPGGTVLPSRFTATGVIDAEGHPVEVEVDVAVDALGVPECLAVTQRPVEGYPLVGSKRLVHEALVAAGAIVESVGPTAGGGWRLAGLTAEAGRQTAQGLSVPARRPRTPHSPYRLSVLKRVAEVSRAARAEGLSEAVEGAHTLCVSEPTAGRYRRAARAAGLLD